MIKSKDYLIDTTKEKAKIIYPDSNLKYEYNDISEIDKITFNLTEEKLKKQLKESNEKILRGKLFIYEKSIDENIGNMYKVFVNETTSKSEKYLAEFERYIDERMARVKAKSTDKDVHLQLAETEIFYQYIEEMLDDVIKSFIDGAFPVYEMIGANSLMPNDIATQIVGVKNDYKSFSDSERKKEIKHIGRSLSGYKALRNFLMEYIRFKNGGYGGLKRTLYSYSEKTINGKCYPPEKIMNQLNEEIKEKKLK